MKCYKRLIYKKIRPNLRSMWPTVSELFAKHFTHHCRALYGGAIFLARVSTLGISGWGCAAGTLEPLIVQLNFGTLN